MFYTASDFEEKFIYVKTYFDECLAFRKPILDLFTPWTRQFLQLCLFSKSNICWKNWKKNSFPIKTFEKNQFLNLFLFNASYFESRNSNASDLEPFFHNSTIFESRSLERVINPKKVPRGIIFRREIDLYIQKKNLMNVLHSENQFWIFLTRGNANFCSYAFSQNPIFVEKIEKKTVFLSRLWERIGCWNQFLTTRHILNQAIHRRQT